MTKSLPLDELLTLIKLLKAEGVQEYSTHGLSLKFSAGEQHQNHRSRQDGRPEAAPEASEAVSDPETTEVSIPDKLRGLNSNYFKLTGVHPRSR